MKSKLEKFSKEFASIALTALASAGIAMLQNYLKTNGIECGATLDPANTSAIGGGIAGAKMVLNYTFLNKA